MKTTHFFCILVLSGAWTTSRANLLRRSAVDVEPGHDDDHLDRMMGDSPAAADPSSSSSSSSSSSADRRVLLGPNDRLGRCDAATVARLTPYHFQILETGLRVYRCWTPRVGRLMGLLRREQQQQQQGRDGGSPPAGQRLSANEGHRLRCRILFKFDTCRSNFADYYSTDDPEISTEWPEEIRRAINGPAAP